MNATALARQTADPGEPARLSVDKALIEVLVRHAPSIFFGNCAVASLSLYVLWDDAPAPALLAWSGLVYGLTLLRMLMVWDFRRRARSEADAVRWAWRFTLTSALSGILWGLGMGWLFFMPENPLALIYAAIVITGMVGGSVASLSAFLPAYFAFAIPAVAPFAFSCFTQGESTFAVMGLLALFLLGVNLAYSRNIHAAVADSVRLRFDNLALIRQLTAEKERAEAANRAKSQFLAAASHDLRQPIHALGLFVATLETLASGAESIRSRDAAAVVVRIQLSLKSLGRLLDSLLDISKLDAGVVSVSHQPGSVQAIFTRLQNEYAMRAQGKSLELRVRPTAAWFDSDPVLLQQILGNFVSNAIKYTDRGGVLLACRRRGPALEIAVWDTGIGIRDDQLDAVFDEFYQLHNPARDREQGLGLGLAIVKRTAKLLGHSVRVRSRPGRGSVFAVTVPRAPVGIEERAPGAAESVPAGPGGEEAVLLIDDDAEVLEAARALVAAWGYPVVAARSLSQAQSALATCGAHIGLIIADYRLGEGVTGADAIRAVRERLGEPVPAIIITGDTSPERIREATRSGLRLLHKPLEPLQLREIVRETMLAASRRRVPAGA